MQRTMADLDLESDDVSERIITLRCGHIFTVETLDGHCQMQSFYNVDQMSGSYIDMASPPTDFQKPPVCPTCRAFITSPRYGRATKRANLDLLETNIAGNMSKDLQNIVAELEVVLATLDEVRSTAKSFPTAKSKSVETTAEQFEDFVQKRLQKLESSENEDNKPLSPKHILGIGGIHGLSGDDYTAWKKWSKPFVTIYEKVVSVACTQGPHVKAYHAALSTLYRLELAALEGDPSRVLHAPESIAIAEVNKKIGQPPHKADTKYQVEALLISIDIRLQLAEIAESRYEGLNREELHGRRVWHSLVDFLYISCEHDTEMARKMAERSSAPRQVARCRTKMIRLSIERTRFDVRFQRDNLILNANLTIRNRQDLVKRLQDLQSNVTLLLRTAEACYIQGRNCNGDRALIAIEQKWFKTECRNPVNKIVQDLEKFIEHIRSDSAYQPLSRKEKADIVAALNFGMCSTFIHRPFEC